jgi:cyclophilin family peptidyl-prolyl cis-trans isomerase
MELFEDTCPKTCDNFKKLCQGFKRPDGKIIGYAGSRFDRIVKSKFIQGGDIGAVMPEGKFHISSEN